MTLFVEVSGRGPNLTLLHGWGLNGAVWNGVRDALAAHYMLHIIDLPGHGLSHGAATLSLTAMADTVANAMPKSSHLLGWSLGGLVAQDLARRHGKRVDKLVLVATTPRFLQSDDWPHAVSSAVLADFGKRLSVNYAATIKSFLALQVLNTPNIRDLVNELQKAITSRGATDLKALAAALDILRTNDLRPYTSMLTQPALVIQGDHDALTPEPAARWMADHMPNARYTMIAHAAHAPFMSHRDAFLREVDTFLSI
ncbi:MAG: pimeloyl-ACP methyl ester esterase BioH [Burkholderiales bacterium]|nr:pimeloyl-ACP methyl ester esterase BioH [Burkholderiales bacterium]